MTLMKPSHDRPATQHMVLPPKAVPIVEPDLPVWEEEPSGSSSLVDTIVKDVPYTPLSFGAVGLLIVIVLIRRLLKRK